MFNTPKHQLIQQGHQLANDLDQSLARLARPPVPAEWGPALSYYETFGDLVQAARQFDSQADLLLRELLTTPVGDEQASLLLILSLLPGVIHRHRNRSHRIADTLIELALYVSQRRPMRSKRPAWNVILDEADRCSRRSLIRVDEYNERTSSLPETVDVIAASWSDCDVEEEALARVQLDGYRSTIRENGSLIDIDGILALSEQSGLNSADRQRLSRHRRRARQLLYHELGEAA